MKKPLMFILAIALAFSRSACGSGVDSNPSLYKWIIGSSNAYQSIMSRGGILLYRPSGVYCLSSFSYFKNSQLF